MSCYFCFGSLYKSGGAKGPAALLFSQILLLAYIFS